MFSNFRFLVVLTFVMVQSAFADSTTLFENRYRIVIPAKNLTQVECKDESLVCIVRGGRFEIMKEEFRTLVYKKEFMEERALIAIDQAIGSKKLLVNAVRSKRENSLEVRTEYLEDQFWFKLKFDHSSDYITNSNMISQIMTSRDDSLTVVITISEVATTRGFSKDEVELKREIGIVGVNGSLVAVPIRTAEKKEFVKILQGFDGSVLQVASNFIQDGVELDNVFELMSEEELSSIKSPGVLHLLEGALVTLEEREKSHKEVEDILNSL